MDLFGAALRDYQTGMRDRLLTIRRDDDHTDAHDPGLYFAEEPLPHERELLMLAKGPVLDVGTGAGRTLLWLQERGLSAVGIDLSPGAVAVARGRGCADVREADVLTADDSVLPKATFRTIILFGNNLGIGGSVEGARTLLTRLARVTRSGGQLLVTGLNVANTSSPHHLAYHDANRRRGRPVGEIKMRFEYEGFHGDWMHWFHPEQRELDGLATDAGWSLKQRIVVGEPFYAAVFCKNR